MTVVEPSLHAERMSRFVRAGLYVVTSQALSSGRTTPEIVAGVLRGGGRLIQLREKDLPIREFAEMACEVRAMTADAGALLIINDRLDVALACGADGVHLGQDDLPIDAARRIAPDLIIGASSHSVEEALVAERQGASYVNIGPLYPTRTKEWRRDFLGLEGLRQVSAAVRIPFTVMGGIKPRHLADLAAAGVHTVAVVTAVTAAPDPAAATRDLLARIRREHPLSN